MRITPRAVIVIVRSNDWEQEKLRALHGLNRRLSGITIITYDEFLAGRAFDSDVAAE